MNNITGVSPETIANNLTPAAPIHPGEVLREEIESRGISQTKVILSSIWKVSEDIPSKAAISTR